MNGSTVLIALMLAAVVIAGSILAGLIVGQHMEPMVPKPEPTFGGHP